MLHKIFSAVSDHYLVAKKNVFLVSFIVFSRHTSTIRSRDARLALRINQGTTRARKVIRREFMLRIGLKTGFIGLRKQSHI